jgi:hypothetical protein
MLDHQKWCLLFRRCCPNLYSRASVSTDSVPAVSVTRGSPRPEKIGKLNKRTVCKSQNARQARTGRNMVKSSIPNAPSTYSSSFVPVPTLPHRTCLYSASSVLAVCISCRLSQCLCSLSPYLSIKLYHIYVCYRNIAYVSRYCSRYWNLSPEDTGAHLCIHFSSSMC